MAVVREPGVELREGLGRQLVPAALGVLADPDQTGLPQHSQMLGGAGLAQAEPVGELTDQVRTLQKPIEDPAPARIREHVERYGHTSNILRGLYTGNDMKAGPQSRGAFASWRD